ncbi:MAG TPA: hypothetical protein V6C84_14350 [Coleofasciculaceae cyanobacterium]|jgi:hypothetical protein
MTLTVGETLQNSKYLVEGVLSQSDFGITYQAQHALLDQPVFLQALNDTVRQRSDFTSLRQQFMLAVRSLSQRSDALRVLDCFEENDLPYVVFQANPGQMPPHLGDWLTLPPEPFTPEALSEAKEKKAQEVLSSSVAELQVSGNTPDSSTAPTLAAEAVAPIPSVSMPEQIPVAVPEQIPVTSPATLAVAPKVPQEHELIQKPELAREPELTREIKLPQIHSAAHNGTTGRSHPIAPLQRRSRVPLLAATLVGLGLGAGAGVALRFQPVADTQRPPSLFGREQTFPAQGDWPITEIPNQFSSEPAIEEPLYRTRPAPDYYSDPIPQPAYNSRTDLYSPSPAPVAQPDAPLQDSAAPQRADAVPDAVPSSQAIDSAPPLNEFDFAPQPSFAPAPAEPAPIAPAMPEIAPEQAPKLFKSPGTSQ